MKHVLVTGATGFIGSHAAREMVSRGHRVTALHRRDTPPAGAGWEWTTTEDLERDQPRFDAVIHTAAVRHRHGISAATYLSENTAQTGRLLDYAKKSQSGRFVFVSSIAVFGWPKQLPISDENPYAPVGPYGASKVACEELVRTSAHPYAIVRPSITYGPGDTNGMVDKLLRLLQAGLYRLVGPGSSRCQLVYVNDLAHAIAEAALGDGLEGAEFTCTYGQPITMRKLSRLCAEAAGARLRWPAIPIPVAKAAAIALEVLEKLGLTGEPLVTREKIDMMTVDRAYDISRMRALLHWEPRTDYREGLQRTAAALKNGA